MNWPDITGWLKMSTTHFFAVGLVTGTMLFSSVAFLKTTGVAEFVDAYRMWIGFAFLVSSGIMVARGLVESTQWLSKRAKWWAHRKRREARLHNLSPDEARALAGYIHGQTRTQNFELEDGMINGLEAEGIVYRASRISVSHTTFAYNIQTSALEYLTAHPELLPPKDKHTSTPRVGRPYQW